MKNIPPFPFRIKAAIHIVKILNDIDHQLPRPMFIWIVIIKWYWKKVDQRNSQMECYKKHLFFVRIHWKCNSIWYVCVRVNVCMYVCVFYVRVFSSVDEICNFNYRTGITHYADWIDRQNRIREWKRECVLKAMTFALVISWHQSVQGERKQRPNPKIVQCNWIIYICYLKWAAFTKIQSNLLH